ncbi:MAG: aspartyl-phosphate phosphatase Spo0E family protein [Firmicutes bacterium]|nr:aspartyl-phosphate phosphatase Spo0E family protein [Bacillota bacterium]
MPIADQASLMELQKALAISLSRNQGLLTSPEVVSLSQELDQLVFKLMQLERGES